jgi:pantothenate kinase-related protein Tda10
MNNGDKNQDLKNEYPKFISSNPCGEDHFATKSQQRIADKICDILQNENSCKIIGIDGGWGSGKSNLVMIVKNRLEKLGDFHFFIYDAWGHQDKHL